MNPPFPLLSPLLLLPGLAFEGILRARNNMYSHGLLVRHRLSRPVISIGNITLGGSGKTPLVIYTAEALRKLGCVPALLSRGYGRRESRKVILLVPAIENSLTTQDLGDEPSLIRRRAPWIWFGIGKDRYSTARKLLEHSSDLTFILDDGFQHRRLERTLDILVIDCSRQLSEDLVFPRGNLREPLEGIGRAHVIMLNLGSASAPPAGFEPFLRRFNPSAPLLHCRQTIESIVPFISWKDGTCEVLPTPRTSTSFLVAAIGNPARFQRDAEYAGLRVCGSRFYRDHARIEPQHWRSCAEEARKRGADFLLTTEKDAIKVTRPPAYPLMVAVQSIGVQEDAEFRNLLQHAHEEIS